MAGFTVVVVVAAVVVGAAVGLGVGRGVGDGLGAVVVADVGVRVGAAVGLGEGVAVVAVIGVAVAAAVGVVVGVAVVAAVSADVGLMLSDEADGFKLSGAANVSEPISASLDEVSMPKIEKPDAAGSRLPSVTSPSRPERCSNACKWSIRLSPAKGWLALASRVVGPAVPVTAPEGAEQAATDTVRQAVKVSKMILRRTKRCMLSPEMTGQQRCIGGAF